MDILYSARFGVTEIGEKEKMKNKLLATLVVLTLLCGMFAMTINFVPAVKAQPPYYLTIIAPDGIVTSPASGVYTYDVEHWANCTAPLEVVIGDTKYLFSNWAVSPSSGDWSAGTGQMWVHVDQNKTAQAVYTKQYKFTVIYPWSAGWIEQFVPAIWQEGSGFVSGSGANGTYWAWINENKKVQAGLKAPDDYIGMGVPQIWGHNTNEIVSFANWTGLGYYISAPWAWSTSCQINMTEPKSATAEWKYIYYLTVESDQAPEPAGEGWYFEDTTVTLTANKIVVNWAREWRLDHWEVDGTPVAGNPINVAMNTNHTASAFYKCWVFIWLGDDIGNMTGIADSGKWYQEGIPYVFTAPDLVPIDSNHRYGFLYWSKVGSGWTNSSNPVTVVFDATWAGYTLRAVYHMQYYLAITSSGSGSVTPIPGSGWYWAGTVVTPGPTAPDTVDIIPGESRYKFDKWVRTSPPGWQSNLNALPTITMDQPKAFVAYYKVQYHCEWSHSPASLTVSGSPGETWFDAGYDLWYSLPATDTSGNYVFKEWVINGNTYPQGQNTVHVGILNASVSGVAEYANKTKIFMDPSYHEETAHAYCNTFDVTVYATNFDATRLVSGKPMDIYAFDLTITFDNTLLELQSVTLNLADFFAPNAYFLGMSDIDNVAGTYHIVATVKGNFTGFSGTKAMFTMKFHVIYDPCFPNVKGNWIYFSAAALSNHYGNGIWPELGFLNTYYLIKTVQPVLEVRNAADHTNMIVVHKNVPTTYFDIEIYLHHGVKVHDFYVELKYDSTHIEAMSVVIADYLKAPYTVYSWVINKGAGIVYVQVAQDPAVPLQNCSGLLFTVRFKVVKMVYYTFGPHGLTSDIYIQAAWLSVKCPNPFLQKLSDGNLGVIKTTYIYNPLPGDLDFDGYVTVLDLQLIMDNFYKVGSPGDNYDITYNGFTDLYDLVFVAIRFGTCV